MRDGRASRAEPRLEERVGERGRRPILDRDTPQRSKEGAEGQTISVARAGEGE